MVTWFSWLTMAGCLNQEAGGSLLKYTTQVKRKLSKLEILKTITTVLNFSKIKRRKPPILSGGRLLGIKTTHISKEMLANNLKPQNTNFLNEIFL